MIPARLAIAVCSIWAASGLAASFVPTLLSLWSLLGSVVVLGLLLDAALVWRSPNLSIERHLPSTLALGIATAAEIRLYNRSARTVRLFVDEHPPVDFEVIHLPRRVRLPRDAKAQLPYTVRALQRGNASFGALRYRVLSPLGFWWRNSTGSGPTTVRVYPNFRAVARFALLALAERTRDIGIRRQRRRGEGTEFQQLREFRLGDTSRQVDWRATARMTKLISRDYRDERDQRLLFLLDCGRRMHSRDGVYSHLDHALNAMLLLAYVALREGDEVGFSTFGGPQRHVAPRKGQSQLNVLLNASFDVTSTTEASDPAAAVESALRGLRRRTLIVLVSNLRDEEDEDLEQALRTARRRHLVLLASLREQLLSELVREVPSTLERALTIAAAHDYLQARRTAHERLSHRGVLYVDVEPPQLASAMVNRYLAIKGSGML